MSDTAGTELERVLDAIRRQFEILKDRTAPEGERVAAAGKLGQLAQTRGQLLGLVKQ